MFDCAGQAAVPGAAGAAWAGGLGARHRGVQREGFAPTFVSGGESMDARPAAEGVSSFQVLVDQRFPAAVPLSAKVIP